MLPQWTSGVYTPISQRDADAKQELQDSLRATSHDEDRAPSCLKSATTLIPWLLFIFTASAYAIRWHTSFQSNPCGETKDNILGAPISWEEKVYTSAIDGAAYDVYSQSNPDVDAAWRAVRYERVTAITALEAQSLPGHRTTAELYGPQDGYAVLLEVFHQIHCLDSLRRAFFRKEGDPQPAGFEGRPAHASHCFSYLLQTLMCHADVGVMTTRWVEDRKAFAAEFNVTRQCRNFEDIKAWAVGRAAKFSPPGAPRESTSVMTRFP